MNEAQEVAVDTVQRVAKGYLNGTTRGQAYVILATTAVVGAVAGVASTVAVIRKRYVVQPKFVKVPREV